MDQKIKDFAREISQQFPISVSDAIVFLNNAVQKAEQKVDRDRLYAEIDALKKEIEDLKKALKECEEKPAPAPVAVVEIDQTENGGQRGDKAHGDHHQRRKFYEKLFAFYGVHLITSCI